MNGKLILLSVALSVLITLTGLVISGSLRQKIAMPTVSAADKTEFRYGRYDHAHSDNEGSTLDLRAAASVAVPAVVHVQAKTLAKSISQRKKGNKDFNELLRQFLDGNPDYTPEHREWGSGVIISDDGYIVTNNHVLTDESGNIPADEIKVILYDKRSYKARIIGRDPASDLAVIKIDEHNLPFIIYGNANEIQTGQWVLAVGYPLTLESTVTAGIISATDVRIHLDGQTRARQPSVHDVFIQTDAAVNQGNSGGALVNTKGELIGINSYLYGSMRTYFGFSFAIPVNVVRKTVNDLIQYGQAVKQP